MMRSNMRLTKEKQFSLTLDLFHHITDKQNTISTQLRFMVYFIVQK